jgi:hypothetical protein
MNESEFRDQLRRSLNLRLSADEVRALMQYFDSNGAKLEFKNQHFQYLGVVRMA